MKSPKQCSLKRRSDIQSIREMISDYFPDSTTPKPNHFKGGWRAECHKFSSACWFFYSSIKGDVCPNLARPYMDIRPLFKMEYLWFVPNFLLFVNEEPNLVGDVVILQFIDDYNMPTGINGLFPFFYYLEEPEEKIEVYLKMKYDASKIKVTFASL